MNKETFKDEKGIFHYEPVVWGDWEEEDEVVFDEVVFDEVVLNLDDYGGYYYYYTPGKTYLVGSDGYDFGPLDENNLAPGLDYKEAFKFYRKVYDNIGASSLKAIENKEEKDASKQEKSLDNLLKYLDNLKQEEKELSAKIDNVIKDINKMLDSYGLAIVYKYDL